ncbi:hypothetical protein [Shinella kummerowiae]|uniref:hypothetical protein n=1 Tax=Shinella kummerowiae TaxID=417745 RepID=UPI0021B62243|nr:hypothetical protein [Shinella kummerowiae]MCT7667526.1 hypothetical protein [Shinella kummerowiae]
MALKHPTFFSAEIAAITANNEGSAAAPNRRAGEPARYLAPPGEETATHQERLVLMDDLEALRLALSNGDANYGYSESIN